MPSGLCGQLIEFHLLTKFTKSEFSDSVFDFPNWGLCAQRFVPSISRRCDVFSTAQQYQNTLL